jgi:hypothetical protein
MVVENTKNVQIQNPEIFQTVSGKSAICLAWSHYSILSKIFDIKARNWYEQEAVRESWSVRTL